MAFKNYPMRQIGNNIIIFLPLTAFVIALFFVPYFYGQRLATCIYKTDFYLIWVTGCACWVYNAINSNISFRGLGKISAIGAAYVFILCLLKSFPDENSIYAFITMVSLIGIVCYLQTLIVSRYSHFLVAGILLAAFIQIYIGYSQAWKSNWESLSVKGWLYNSGLFASYLAAILPLLLSGAMFRPGGKSYIRIISVIGFIVIVALLILTMARAAFIGFALGCFFVMSSFIRRITIKNWIAVTLISVLILPITAFALYKLKPKSALGRLTIYKVSMNIVKEHPLTGVGPNRFSSVYNNYQSDYFKTRDLPIETQLLASNTLEAYNSIIQVLVEYGIPGILLLFWATHLLIKSITPPKGIANNNWLRIGSIGCLISTIASSFFSNPFHATPILLLVVFHLSSALPRLQQPILVLNKRTFLPLLCAVFWGLLICCYSISQHQGETKWREASRLAKYDNFINARKVYEEAYKHLKFNGDFLFNYGAEACMARDYPFSIKLLEASKKYNSFSNIFIFLGNAYTETGQFVLAEKNYLAAIYMTPSHVYPKYQIVRLYKKLGRTDHAKYWTDKILQYPVKVKSDFIGGLIDKLKEGEIK